MTRNPMVIAAMFGGLMVSALLIVYVSQSAAERQADARTRCSTPACQSVFYDRG